MRFDLYSKRQKDIARSGQSDVYKYDDVPSTFRMQLLNIAKKTFGQEFFFAEGTKTNLNWVWVDDTYSYEKGIGPLGGVKHTPEKVRLQYLAMKFEDAIDFTEVLGYKLYLFDEKIRGRLNQEAGTSGPLIDEINYRLREAEMGYQFVAGRLTRVDSQLIHQEVIKPALSLLSQPGFEGAQEEFLKAHAHYRDGQNKEAVAMAANALESTFKAIFDIKGWTYRRGSRISDLVKVARENSLWPDYLDNSFDQLVATLQSGLPKIRDNDASHGQGSAPKEVPSYLTAYALHLAASKIVFLATAAAELP